MNMSPMEKVVPLSVEQQQRATELQQEMVAAQEKLEAASRRFIVWMQESAGLPMEESPESRRERHARERRGPQPPERVLVAIPTSDGKNLVICDAGVNPELARAVERLKADLRARREKERQETPVVAEAMPAEAQEK